MRSAIFLITIFILVLVCTNLAQPEGLFTLLDRDYINWYPLDLVVRDSLVFAISYNSLHVLNFVEPDNPRQVGTWDFFPDNVSQITLLGDFAICNNSNDIFIVDISEPAEPNLAGFLHIEMPFIMLKHAGDRGYVLDDDFWLNGPVSVIDFSDPTEPTLLGVNPPFGASAIDFEVAPDRFYASGFPALAIYDTSDPDDFQLLGYDDDTDGYSLEIVDHFAFITTSEGMLRVIDISGEQNPQQVGELELPGNWVELTTFNNDLLVASIQDRSVAFIDISDPTSPQLISEIEDIIPDAHYPGPDNSLYVVESNYGNMEVWDISDLDNIETIGRLPREGHAREITLGDSIGFLSNGSNGLVLYDMSNPAQLDTIGLIPTVGKLRQTILDGDIAYLACLDSGLFVWDVSDLLQPEELARLVIPNQVQDFALQDSVLFTIVGSGNHNYGRVVSIDVTDPTNPSIIGGNPDVWANSLVIQDTLLFVIHRLRHEITILDATSPEDLPSIGTVDVARDPSDIAIIGDRVFLSDTYDGLIVVDIADPSRPRLIGNWDVGTGISVVATRDYVFLGGHSLIYVFDAHPDENYNTVREIGVFAIPGNIYDMKILGNLFYIAGSITVQLLRFDGPESVDREPASGPSHFIIHPPYPNPFNSTTSISYALPIVSEVSLNLYNLTGKRIKTLFKGKQQTGGYSVTLEAHDLASGLYFVRLRASDQVFTQKVMLIR